MLPTVLSAVFGLALAMFGPAEFSAPPQTPPAYTEPRPQLADDGYITHRESILIEAPREHVYRWANDPDRELSDYVQGGESDFPAVVHTDALIGDWDPTVDRTGDRRRVQFADGHYLAEEVVEDSQDVFRYVIWGFTDPRQRHSIDHAVAAFHYADHGDHTLVTWTYSFQPLVPVLRPLVQSFVDQTMPTLMTQTLTVLKDGAEAAQ